MSRTTVAVVGTPTSMSRSGGGEAGGASGGGESGGGGGGASGGGESGGGEGGASGDGESGETTVDVEGDAWGLGDDTSGIEDGNSDLGTDPPGTTPFE